MQIGVKTGLRSPALRSATDLLETGGWSAIFPVVHGCFSGDGRLLSQAKKNTIQRMIIGKRQEHLKMNFSLWRRAGPCLPIKQKSGIQLWTRSIGKYFTRWSFTLHKPIKRTYQQSLVLSPASLQGAYTTIEQPAKAEATEFLQDMLGFMRFAFLFCKFHFATTEHTRHLLQMR